MSWPGNFKNKISVNFLREKFAFGCLYRPWPRDSYFPIRVLKADFYINSEGNFSGEMGN